MLHQYRRLILMIIVTAMTFSVSCLGTIGFKPPEKGVTEQFFRESGDELVNLATYDFSRLENGHGLFVFSYEFVYDSSVITNSRRGDKGIRGIRVWEHKFNPSEWDIKRVQKQFQFWRIPDESTAGLTSHGWMATLMYECRKGRIVYGGRIHIDHDTYFETGPSVSFHFDEDMGEWLKVNADRVSGIKIDTVIMAAGY